MKNDALERIQLSGGKTAIVDPEDFSTLSQYKWFASESKKGHFYAMRSVGSTGKIQMHREITNCPEDMIVDHINGNSLDNRKSNLRICSHSENMRNQKLRSGSEFKGVGFCKIKNKYRARIMLDRKDYHLGYFDTKEDAAKAYAEASKNYHGEYGSDGIRIIKPPTD